MPSQLNEGIVNLLMKDLQLLVWRYPRRNQLMDEYWKPYKDLRFYIDPSFSGGLYVLQKDMTELKENFERIKKNERYAFTTYLESQAHHILYNYYGTSFLTTPEERMNLDDFKERVSTVTGFGTLRLDINEKYRRDNNINQDSLTINAKNGGIIIEYLEKLIDNVIRAYMGTYSSKGKVVVMEVTTVNDHMTQYYTVTDKVNGGLRIIARQSSDATDTVTPDVMFKYLPLIHDNSVWLDEKYTGLFKDVTNSWEEKLEYHNALGNTVTIGAFIYSYDMDNDLNFVYDRAKGKYSLYKPSEKYDEYYRRGLNISDVPKEMEWSAPDIQNTIQNQIIKIVKEIENIVGSRAEPWMRKMSLSQNYTVSGFMTMDIYRHAVTQSLGSQYVAYLESEAIKKVPNAKTKLVEKNFGFYKGKKTYTYAFTLSPEMRELYLGKQPTEDNLMAMSASLDQLKQYWEVLLQAVKGEFVPKEMDWCAEDRNPVPIDFEVGQEVEIEKTDSTGWVHGKITGRLDQSYYVDADDIVDTVTKQHRMATTKKHLRPYWKDRLDFDEIHLDDFIEAYIPALSGYKYGIVQRKERTSLPDRWDSKVFANWEIDPLDAEKNVSDNPDNWEHLNWEDKPMRIYKKIPEMPKEMEWGVASIRFKIGDRVRCVNNNDVNYLTMNKEYEVLDVDKDGWPVINDDLGAKMVYHPKRFAKVEIPEMPKEMEWNCANMHNASAKRRWNSPHILKDKNGNEITTGDYVLLPVRGSLEYDKLVIDVPYKIIKMSKYNLMQLEGMPNSIWFKPEKFIRVDKDMPKELEWDCANKRRWNSPNNRGWRLYS